MGLKFHFGSRSKSSCLPSTFPSGACLEPHSICLFSGDGKVIAFQLPLRRYGVGWQNPSFQASCASFAASQQHGSQASFSPLPSCSLRGCLESSTFSDCKDGHYKCNVPWQPPLKGMGSLHCGAEPCPWLLLLHSSAVPRGAQEQLEHPEPGQHSTPSQPEHLGTSLTLLAPPQKECPTQNPQAVGGGSPISPGLLVPTEALTTS